jgi:two-component system, cell cycle sensor histidine kinase and response regulator CckA
MFHQTRRKMALEKSIATQSKSGSTAGQRKHIILLVEDETAVRNLVTRLLALHGYRVLAAEDGRSAATLWKEHKDDIDLLLTDVLMPGGLSGREVAREFTSEKPGLKVLYTSGYNFAEPGDDTSSAPQLNFVPKPYRPDQLLAAVESALATTPDFATYAEDSSR